MSNPKLYWKNAGSGVWNDVANWWTDAEATTQANNAPWVDGVDATYLAYDLTLATGAVDSPAISSTIGTGATGSCDIAGITNNNNINGGTFSGDNFTNTYGSYLFDGTFTGDNFTNEGHINGGTFTGDSFYNNSDIYGGTFTGDYFYNYGDGYIHGGTFTGSGFNNNSAISGGTFSGNNFTNNNNSNAIIDGGTFSGGNFTNNGEIDGGTFEITGFTNSGAIVYSSISVTSGGTPYTGNWQGQGWLDGSWVSEAPITILYYTNAGGDSNWETLTNWNTAADGSGDNPTNIPWTSDGSSGAWYADTYLVDASGGAGVSINSTIDPNGVVTGTCDIAGIANNGTIYGGTFSGASFSNYFGTINDGTFSGAYFNNLFGTINGGTFSCGDFCQCGFLPYDSCGNCGSGCWGNTCDCGCASYDSCGNCGTECWGNQCDCGCASYDSCGSGICGGGCSIACCDGTNCGSDDYGCGCGNPAPSDDCHNCDGSCGGVNGCVLDCSGNCGSNLVIDGLGICGGDAILGCDGGYYSPINELGLDIPLHDGLFGQMYYYYGSNSASFSDGPSAENPQFFIQYPEYKTLTYTTTEIRNFYVDSEYVIQNLNPADFTQFGGGDSLQQYSWQFIGRFRAPYTDDFSFSTWSDDASYLWLGDNAITGYTTANAIVQNGGSHGNNIASSDPVSLNSGDYYPIRIQYGQGGGGAVLSVAYSSNTETNVTNWSGIAYSYPQCSPDFAINGECCPSASGSLGSGLVAYWNFDNNLVDHTLNGYNLSGYNGSYYGSGIINSGISFPYVSDVSYLFNGSGGFVNNINIGGNQTWSISCWFKADNIYPNAPQAIWGLGGGGYGDTTLYINGTNGISLYSYGQGGSTEIIPNTGEWYYSALNASPTGMNLYINNSLAISIPSPSENSFSGLSLSDFLGECPSGECAMVGTVDEMGYWNRELTLNEICNLYYSGSGNAFPFRQQPLCYDIIPPSSGMFIPNFIAPGLPISTAFNGKFSLSQLAGLPPTIQF